jgi:hypothetical protein
MAKTQLLEAEQHLVKARREIHRAMSTLREINPVALARVQDEIDALLCELELLATEGAKLQTRFLSLQAGEQAP